MRAPLCLIVLAVLLPAQSSVQVAGALAAGSYFPLDAGNRWVYRVDSRGGTAGYETWRIDRTEEIGGKQYAVFTIIGSGVVLGESRFRADDQGRVFILTGTGDELFLDARAGAGPGILQPGGPGGTYTNPLGSFADTLKYSNRLDALDLETGILGRGIGLLSSTRVLETGSSGGFTSGRTLVEAVVGGGAIRFTAGAAGLHVGMENLTLDVTGKQVTNCVLPCYFAACGFAGPVPDPPGTYKPCARARVSLENWPADASRAVRLRLLAPDNTVLYDQPFTLVSAPGEVAITTQIPLYSAPNQPYPPGAYQLSAATADGAAQSAVTVVVR
jgi:hypothetical protein